MAEAREKNQRDILRDRVVDLVVEFINREGGMSQDDLGRLFGPTYEYSVALALRKIPIKYPPCKAQEAPSGTSQSKQQVLRDKVVELVKNFMNREGGISQYYLSGLFGPGTVTEALSKIPLTFSQGS